jgi:hypothetical protein
MLHGDISAQVDVTKKKKDPGKIGMQIRNNEREICQIVSESHLMKFQQEICRSVSCVLHPTF